MAVQITSRKGDAVPLSRDEYDALEQTVHLLKVPANASRLSESRQQSNAGILKEPELSESGWSSHRMVQENHQGAPPRLSCAG
ncbi:hypothetical protein CVS29_13100 [Arthrobacter psychrochitiniphilus]|uniref:Antitoxin n=1 Tax=Arthrobacter psychrochitiniphilus TaxID=291045 RepID=A0A2V3DPX6_9MICC|nr:hypothetical protein CVS29_13100 [Arthrobacter psychrochitiniphilus]